MKDELSSGHLVHPFGPSIAGFLHHLLTREGESGAATMAAARWLLSEAQIAVPRA